MEVNFFGFILCFRPFPAKKNFFFKNHRQTLFYAYVMTIFDDLRARRKSSMDFRLWLLLCGKETDDAHFTLPKNPISWEKYVQRWKWYFWNQLIKRNNMVPLYMLCVVTHEIHCSKFYKSKKISKSHWSKTLNFWLPNSTCTRVPSCSPW